MILGKRGNIVLKFYQWNILSLQWFCNQICHELISNFEKTTIEGIVKNWI